MVLLLPSWVAHLSVSLEWPVLLLRSIVMPLWYPYSPPQSSPPQNFQNQKLRSISPVPENSKNFNPANFPKAFNLEYPYWYNTDTQDEENDKNNILTLPDDVSHLRDPIWNLRDHESVDAKVLNTASCISVEQALLVNEKKTISAIMDKTCQKYAWL